MNLYNKNGFFTKEGKQLVTETVGYEVKKLLDTAKTVEEVRTLGSLISNYIGNMVCDKVQDLK